MVLDPLDRADEAIEQVVLAHAKWQSIFPDLQLRYIVFEKNDWVRSEERRVGKECRSRWSPYH